MSVVGTDPPRDDEALTAWIGAAVELGERVLVVCGPGGADAVSRLLAVSGVRATASAGQIELADAQAMRADPAVTAETLTALVDSAIRDGWSGLALTDDGTVASRLSADAVEQPAYERAVDRLSADGAMRVLCRVPLAAGDLGELLELHHRDVDGGTWAARVDRGRLWLRGELDAANAGAVTRVLRAGVQDGVTDIDVSAVEFCAVAGVRALAAAATAAPGGGGLTLHGVRRPVAVVLELTGARRAGLRPIAPTGSP